MAWVVADREDPPRHAHRFPLERSGFSRTHPCARCAFDRRPVGINRRWAAAPAWT